MRQGLALAPRVLGGAVVLGVLGDGLLRVGPWSVNLVVWLMALVGTGGALLRWRRLPAQLDGRLLLGASLGFASLLAVRDSGTLRTLNLLSALTALALGLAALRAWPGQVRVAALTDYALTTVYAGTHAVAGAVPLVFREMGWRRLPGGRWWTAGIAAVRGVLIAVPLLFVFGGLLMAADAAFEAQLRRLLDVNLGDTVDHLVGTSLIAWVAAGTLRGVTLEEASTGGWLARPAPDLPERRRLRLGFIELGTVLGLLDALFAAFVLVQARYLFGGAAQVAPETGLTYATYARRGFFELVTVTGLAVPLLLLAHSLLRAANPTQERVFRWLSGALVALLFAVMASALQRMRLYQETYGLTELRVYTTAFMLWLGVLLAWFLATVQRGQRRRFAVGALVSGLGVVVLLNVANPDAVIARSNARRGLAAVPAGGREALLDAPHPR